MVLPFARTQEGVEPLDSLRDAFEEQIGCFPESFGDVMRFYQSHIDQGVYRNCLFASDRRLRNLRHLLYSMMQRRTKAIADVFPEAVLVPWSSLSLVASNLDSPARQALEACMPHVRKTSIPLVAEQICPIWPRPTAVSILATKRAEVRLSQQSVVPSKLGGSVALPDGKDLISPSREKSLAHCSNVEREGDVKAGHRRYARYIATPRGMKERMYEATAFPQTDIMSAHFTTLRQTHTDSLPRVAAAVINAGCFSNTPMRAASGSSS